MDHRNVKAVTFDVGSTLIECWPSVGHIYAEVAARHGAGELSAAALNGQFKAAWQAATRFDYSRAGWAELVDASFRGLTELRPSKTFFDELYDRFSEPRSWRVFEDVVPTLTALKGRGLKLGVISNWDARLEPLLGRLKLRDYFNSVVVSCQRGVPKPSRAIFDEAAGELGLPAATILHVGDSREMDFDGARGAGFQALLLSRATQSTAGGFASSLLELASCV